MTDHIPEPDLCGRHYRGDNPLPWDKRCEHCGAIIDCPDCMSYQIDEDKFWCNDLECIRAYQDEREAEY